MRRILILAGVLAASITTGQAQPFNPPIGELASLLDRHGFGDVRSLEASHGILNVMARMQDGSAVRAAIDQLRGTLIEAPAKLPLVRYGEPAAPQMTFHELAALLDEKVPGGRLVELKRNQGAYEVHLRAPDGKALGMLVDLKTRRIMPYHSLD